MKTALTLKSDGSTEFSIDDIDGFLSKIFLKIFCRHKTEKDFIEELKKTTFKDIIKKMHQEGLLSYLELSQCKNFIDIAKLADNYVKEEFSNEHERNYKKDKISDTYAIRLFEKSSQCYDEEVKEVWARLMASAVSRKGKYHLQTLDILNQLTCEDLDNFNKFVDICILEEDKGFCPEDDSYLNSNKISLQLLIYLEELGLLKMQIHIHCVYEVRSNQMFIRLGEKTALCYENLTSQNIKIQVRGYFLTTSGLELAKLYRKTSSDRSIRGLWYYMKKNYSSLKANICPIVYCDNKVTRIDFENPIKL